MLDCKKSFSDISYFSVISELASIGYLFYLFIFFHLVSLIFGMMTDFLLKLGHFRYFMRFWILFKPSGFTWLSPTLLWQKKGKFQVPHLLPGEGQISGTSLGHC